MIQLATLNQATANAINTELPLAAVVDSALCVGAGGSSGSLADKPILKNAEGRLVIPASQVKGRLRHECEKLARGLKWPVCESPSAALMCPQRAGIAEGDTFRLQAYRLQDFLHHANGAPQYHCLICQLFGNPSLPARLQFGDLVCTEPPDAIPEVLRPGVTINRRRRTAEDQKLYFLETSPANVKLRFEGHLEILPPWTMADSDAVVPDVAMALVRAAMAHIHALGGSKSAGLGWLHWEWPQDQQAAIADEVWTFLGEAQQQAKDNATEDDANDTTQPGGAA
ncbi:CRISPR-associated protein Csm3 [Leptolyngbya cf. ectocarpi LEGE 11479]|uniref:CRISPR-associated protein Csm3 n=1 Tax=Leptolyngbya cf. ectocarpi LEGE 11479 TaxID=1828722 RepID=A0A929F9E5_LEPEC|nr:RAMP superfamily CRISPR-associated protein [Leptolyngbya ectocarpi]MBE9067524.1 CRISPR-associated protein Csm3 [Leptolyngbya cf. ectocarpi LEGE 11479]